MAVKNNDKILDSLKADCENCFGLCCVALPYAKSADFACDKESGKPCSNLQPDYRCKIHHLLREKGFRGCASYECFGAGQKVSQDTYKEKNWRENPEMSKEMFNVFSIMQQLHEMLYYLNEALNFEETQPIHMDLRAAIEETEDHTNLSPKLIMEINISDHRVKINDVLLKTSKLVRAKAPLRKNNKNRGRDLIGAKLKGADLRGANLRGAILIAADLRDSDMRMADLIGADFRDADLRGANLTGSIFLTQAQVNSAKGDSNTKLPSKLRIPQHWE